MHLLGFNTQPHGGGCWIDFFFRWLWRCFNTQPHGGGCPVARLRTATTAVSTHSRTEAAAIAGVRLFTATLCFNTQPHGGGCLSGISLDFCLILFQHTAARRRLLSSPSSNMPSIWFQHTAARRRLPKILKPKKCKVCVSTHSRTEAAAYS